MTQRPSPVPKQKIIIVPVGEQHTPKRKLVNYWVFGPKTQHPWPSGDFHDVGGIGVSESAWELDVLLRQKDITIYHGPDMRMDKGL